MLAYVYKLIITIWFV